MSFGGKNLITMKCPSHSLASCGSRMVEYRISDEVVAAAGLPDGWYGSYFEDARLRNAPYYFVLAASRNKNWKWQSHLQADKYVQPFECTKAYALMTLASTNPKFSDNFHFIRNSKGDGDKAFCVRMENRDASFFKSTCIDDAVLFSNENDYVEMEFTFNANKGRPPFRFVAGFHSPIIHRTEQLIEFYGSREFWKNPVAIHELFELADISGAGVIRDESGLIQQIVLYQMQQTAGETHNFAYAVFHENGSDSVYGIDEMWQFFDHARVVGCGEETI